MHVNDDLKKLYFPTLQVHLVWSSVRECLNLCLSLGGSNGFGRCAYFATFKKNAFSPLACWAYVNINFNIFILIFYYWSDMNCWLLTKALVTSLQRWNFPLLSLKYVIWRVIFAVTNSWLESSVDEGFLGVFIWGVHTHDAPNIDCRGIFNKPMLCYACPLC